MKRDLAIGAAIALCTAVTFASVHWFADWAGRSFG